MPRRKKAQLAKEATSVTTDLIPPVEKAEDFVDPLPSETVKEDVLEYMYGTKEPTRLERTLLTLLEKNKSL